MDMNKAELEVVKNAEEQAHICVQELNDFELALVGGGIGSVIVA